VDPARRARKTVTRRQDGFKAHVVVDPDTGLVIGCALTSANGSSGRGGRKVCGFSTRPDRARPPADYRRTVPTRSNQQRRVTAAPRFAQP